MSSKEKQGPDIKNKNALYLHSYIISAIHCTAFLKCIIDIIKQNLHFL